MNHKLELDSTKSGILIEQTLLNFAVYFLKYTFFEPKIHVNLEKSGSYMTDFLVTMETRDS